MDIRLLLEVLPRFRDRGSQGGAGGLFQVTDGPQAEGDAVGILQHLLCLPFAQVVRTTVDRDGGLQTRPEGAGGHAGGQGRRGRLAALATGQGVQLVFGNDRPDRRQLGYLVARIPGIVPAQGCLTVATALRLDHDDRVHLGAGQQRPLAQGMAGLAAGSATRRRPLGALGDLGRSIRGGRQRGVARVLLQAGFQFRQARVQALIFLLQGIEQRQHFGRRSGTQLSR